MKLSFSKHAQAKVQDRQITDEILTIVLQNPQRRFYDTNTRAQVAVRGVDHQGVSVNLVVVFRKKNDIHHIVTAYPVKDVRSEVERKVKSGRWIPI